MAINIKNPETEVLARKLADLTGETITETVKRSLEDRLHRRSRVKPSSDDFMARIDAIVNEFNALPVYDDRTPDEIIGYNESGGFH
ncbi:MAG: type II toxin-antitoxin system VapB family antitoxin [Bryobacteraceae bacterium]|nr:type II toxin-antitoxin system VapB family antitoxin [Bryobacteraceae bacterium]